MERPSANVRRVLRLLLYPLWLGCALTPALGAQQGAVYSVSLGSLAVTYLPQLLVILMAAVSLTALRMFRGARQSKEQLEEHLALQQQLLEQEREQHRSNDMITAMAADYRSVYYIDLDQQQAVCYRANKQLRDNTKEGDVLPYPASFETYARRYVAEQDREAFLDFLRPERIREGLAQESMISLRYLTVKDGQEKYEMLRMAGVRRPADREDGVIHAVGAGFTNVDRETREDLARSRALTEALEQAKQANAAKSAFLSSMSHEIRTPMNAIVGLANIALRDPDISAVTREQIQKIDASAQHMLSLINVILDMGEIESGYSTLKQEEFSFPELLHQLVWTVEGQCRDKGLQFLHNVSGDFDACFIGDAVKLKQALMNILNNALKFTDAPGAVTFEAHESPLSEGVSQFRFIVSDSGIGIGEEFLPHVFDAFAQEDDTITSRYGGSGVGLAIAKNTIDLMGGEIHLESERGKGTIVTVTVPLQRGETPAEPEQAQEEVYSLAGKHVLIVEDNDINAEILIDLLDLEDITSQWVVNGRLAVNCFRGCPPGHFDAVLMDLRMPVMDGLTCAREIRRLDRRDAKTVPIIALTANAFQEDVKNCLAAGMNAHLSKPVDLDLLLETLRKFIPKQELL